MITFTDPIEASTAPGTFHIRAFTRTADDCSLIAEWVRENGLIVKWHRPSSKKNLTRELRGAEINRWVVYMCLTKQQIVHIMLLVKGAVAP